MASSKGNKIEVQNLNHPGLVKSVEADMYEAMKRAYLEVVPATAPGLTLDQIRERLPPLLPQELYPGGAGANWWAKTVQLDLEAKGLIRRDNSTPMRLHKA